MKTFDKILNPNAGAMIICSAATLLFLISFFSMTAVAAPLPGPGQEAMHRGEQMYRTGILPSGEPMQSYVKGDIPVSGSSFTCISCHMRSGLGSVEGGVYTTPTDGKTLYQRRDKAGSGNNRRNAAMDMGSKSRETQAIIQPPPARPAYTDASLADVLRGGSDPSGRILDAFMPRYHLADQEMADLIAYIKTLSVEHSPGVDRYSINFATVVTDEVAPELVEAMMQPIESFVASANKQQAQLEEQQVKLLEIPKDVTYRPVKHSRWILRGEPDTWRGQLEEYYRKQPVFALIGGITSKKWQPVHDFSEEHAIPCILPDTGFPVVSGNNGYTLYFSKGPYQEGEAAARFLQSTTRPSKPVRIVQIVSATFRGKALSDGFLGVLKNDPSFTLSTIQLAADQPVARSLVQKLMEQDKPDLLVFWTEAGVLESLASFPEMASSGMKLIMSSGNLGTRIMTIPEQLREMTYITYPYRTPQDEKQFERFTDQKLSDDAKRVQGKAYSMLQVLTQSLRDLKGDFYRDYLLDVIDMRPDITSTPYERLSFGAGQRYASKGCYIVQLTRGSKPQLIKKSEWVIL